MTQSQIADRVGVSQMQVSRLIRRALARLRAVRRGDGQVGGGARGVGAARGRRAGGESGKRVTQRSACDLQVPRRFLDLLAENDRPPTNRPAGGQRVDCRRPEQRLTVELDSYRLPRLPLLLGAGPSPSACEDVFERPAVVVREVAEALAQARPSAWYSRR